MLDLGYPRDLVMTGAIFGLAAFIWAGWAQENPPTHVVWRVVLAVLSAAGLALAALSVPLAIKNWRTPSAIDPHSAGFVFYVIVFWVEVAVAIVLAIIATRAGRSDLIAPLILAIVGIHFFALAVVFGQPVLHLAGALITAIAIIAAFLPREVAAPSFWCGLFAAPIFLAIGAWCLIAGRSALTGPAA
ncbi:hypothetical protein ET475_07200 [Microbacterium protaetiae]|uniref:Uncharacterized protein n=1 Tax=Microbacterium protaetiae TaxID=2509458 RepID=A0A4P6EI19_9MICO|nr:hypothetical protein [Microbacterium protaetiae]QAY59797.1 hypothetical protein ET475_07200 [Microbacterium protaetiae]